MATRHLSERGVAHPAGGSRAADGETRRAPEAVPRGALPVHVIRPTRGLAGPGLRHLWEYRDLLAIFVRRDLQIRYKQTLIGVAWAIVQPVATMLIVTLVFGRLARVPTGGLPYPVLAYSGLVVWQVFARALTEGATSLSANERVITKVYFPRALFPTSVVLSALADLLLGLPVLGGLLIWYRQPVSPAIAALPVALLIVVVASLGAAYLFSALDARYRDVRYAVPFLAQLWLFASPVFYSSAMVPAPWRPAYGLNPMAGAVEAVRWAVLGTPADPAMVAASAASAALLFAGGLTCLRWVERTLADQL